MDIKAVEKDLKNKKISEATARALYDELQKHISLLKGVFRKQYGTIPEDLDDLLQRYSAAKLTNLKYWKDLLKQATTFKAVVQIANRRFKGYIKKELRKKANAAGEKALRYFKDLLKKRADNQQDFKCFTVSQKELINNDQKVYGDILWQENYEQRGIFQSNWMLKDEDLQSHPVYSKREVSERKGPYSDKQFIDGTKKLLEICNQYISPRHIFIGLNCRWMDFHEQTISIEELDDHSSDLGKEETETITNIIDFYRYSSILKQIVLKLSEKERKCFLTVVRLLVTRNNNSVYSEASDILHLKSAQDVKNNYNKATKKITKQLVTQEEILLFSKTLGYYFEKTTLGDLTDIDEVFGGQNE